MPIIFPRYFPPPRGHRTRREGPGGYTRRDKEEGPYGLFIEHDDRDVAIPLNEYDDLSSIEPFWQRAGASINMILWGNRAQREMAARELRQLNMQIDATTGNFGLGIIETSNWYNAGEQLFKALRDFHMYGATARFEDVRDFIWERIQVMNYPTDWRIKAVDFAREIESYAGHNARLRKNRPVDTDDSIFNEWLLENVPQPYAPPPTYEHTERASTQVPAPPMPPGGGQNPGQDTVISQFASHIGSARPAVSGRSNRPRNSRQVVTRQRQPIPATVRPAPSLRRPVPSRRPR
ncbi:hypothetical protein CNMCM5878_004813 [Aspergillus fumigatiaffinis]|nr:hypothetical protein CNMCM5878_004813 [Aspergillus fumigatiaffinis]